MPKSEKRLSRDEEVLAEDRGNTPPVQAVPPDGGLKGWLAVSGAFMALVSTMGLMNAFGVFLEYYGTHQLSNMSSFEISWLGAFNIFILFIGGLPVGVLNDRYGPRPLMMTGSVLYLFSLCMVSLCTKYWQFFLAQGVLLAISISLLFAPATSALAKYFTGRRAVATGIAIGGSSIGGVIWPIAISRLLENPKLGFPWTIRIIALINLPLLIFSCLAINPPVTPRPSPTVVEKESNVMSLLKDSRFIMLALGMFLVYLGLFSAFFYITPFAISIGVDENLSFYLVSILNGTSLFGRVLPGLVADKYGRFNMLIIVGILSGVVDLCWMGVTNTVGAVFFSMAYGFVSGSVLSLQFVCVTLLVPPQKAGTAVGLLSAALSIGGLFGTPISGQLWDRYGLTALSVYSGVAMFAGTLCVVIARLRTSKDFFAIV